MVRVALGGSDGAKLMKCPGLNQPEPEYPGVRLRRLGECPRLVQVTLRECCPPSTARRKQPRARSSIASTSTSACSNNRLASLIRPVARAPMPMP